MGEVQDTSRSVWSFHSGSVNGTLLSGLTFDGKSTYWGDPTQAYTIPTAGPIFSDIHGSNENAFFDRPPSFTGIMMHPGNDTQRDSVAVFSPQNEVTIAAITVNAEVLGDVSNGVAWTVGAVISGTPTTLIPASAAFYSPNVAHQTFTPTPGILPITLKPGDSLYIRTNNLGNPGEDWANTEMFLVFSGGPIVIASPQDAKLCINKSGSLSATMEGSGPIAYVWQYQEGNGPWKDLSDGPLTLSTTETVATITHSHEASMLFTLLGAPELTNVHFRCVGTNGCHSAASAAAQILGCLADRNCDGVVDLNDFFDWFNCWDATSSCADIDGNGDIDLSDFFAFFTHFDASC